MKISEDDKIRFLKHINKTDTCWIWTGSRNKNKKGYGQITVKGKTIGAHVFSYLLYKGEIAENLSVLHKCDTPSCVNPKCLYTGTLQDNMNDMKNKGRQAKGDKHGLRLHPECAAKGDRNGTHTHPEKVTRGEKHPSAKLLIEEILEIRKLYLEKYTITYIAKKFKVSRNAIYKIVNNISWKIT